MKGGSSGVEISASGVILNDIPRLACACSIVGAAFTVLMTPDWVSDVSVILIVGSILSRLVSLSSSPPVVTSGG